MFGKFVILLIFPGLNIAIPNEYCLICRSHTMCKYLENVIPENCTGYERIELTPENKSDIVEIHNKLRNFVASGGYVNETDTRFPEAAAMNYLRWSEELASIAQRWADQCRTDENRDECRDIEEFQVGQNVIVLEISAKGHLPNFPDVFMAEWSDSFHRFSLKDIFEYSYNELKTNDIGKYPQLILDMTEYIGCASMSFKSPFTKVNSTVQIVRIVCNYGPYEKIRNKPIYKVGPSCTACISKKCHEKFRSLCIVGSKKPIDTHVIEQNKINEDVRKILQNYNLFQNGDKCFCETENYDTAGTNIRTISFSLITVMLNVALCFFIIRN